MLELHIWGPAFALPSVDPQCLAAVAYFSHVVPRGEWTLVASSPSLNPTRELPAVRSGTVWVAGFGNIVDFVGQVSGGEWGMDGELEGGERADLIAFSSFVEARGQALLDLSLYVSSQNYNAVTRPIFSTIQTFPLTWITPQKLRTAAKARTEHLGLSSLDIDTDAEPEKERSVVPESLRRPDASLTSLLSSDPESAAQIRLDGLATSFLEPLQDLRGQKRFFISSQPTSLDCLALGYLALALFPDLPSPWLSRCLRTKFPQLCAFVHDAQRLFFGGSVTLVDACLAPESDEERERRARGKSTLPWTKGDTGSLLAVGGVLAAHLADSIPVVSQLVQSRRMQRALEKAAEEDPEAEAELALAHLQITTRRREMYITVGSVVAGLGLFVGFMFQQGLVAVLSGEKKSKRGLRRGVGGSAKGKDGDESSGGGWGHVEPGVAALAQHMDFLGDLQFGGQQQEHEHEPVEVEVEVEPALPHRAM